MGRVVVVVVAWGLAGVLGGCVLGVRTEIATPVPGAPTLVGVGSDQTTPIVLRAPTVGPSPVPTVEVIDAPATPLTLSGLVGGVAVSSGTIWLAEPLGGIDRVVLTDATRLIDASGSPLELAEVHPGALIQAWGEFEGESGLLAVQVRIAAP